jgi:hypothetical protein
MKWISEAERLPAIAQKVLLAVPRQHGEFWDLKIAQLLVRHEDVFPRPVAKGSRWPTDYYWDSSRDGRDVCLITGNSWWALMDNIPLPPGAEHMAERGFHYIAQPTPVFVSQSRPSCQH